MVSVVTRTNRLWSSTRESMASLIVSSNLPESAFELVATEPITVDLVQAVENIWSPYKSFG
jgi:hypothetical protein